MLDLEPATGALTALVTSIRDDQLDAATPCPGMPVAALLEHVHGFALAFAWAARKEPGQDGPPPAADAARLPADWRDASPARLSRLALAWREPAAWSGPTAVGGVQLTGDAAGLFALDEVVVHGWDLAAALGETISFDPALLAPLCEFLTAATAEQPDGTPGLFGPRVPVADTAPLLNRIVGLTGRDPHWAPPVPRTG